MPLSEVMEVLDALASEGCRFWLEGGWGIDALVGHQTRSHRDLDIDIDSQSEATALRLLAELGYAIETDWRPNRVELVARGRGWVDIHPLLFDARGNARQAALNGGFHEFPRSYFAMGSLAGIAVPCVSASAQRVFHAGYEWREVDAHDIAQLDALDGGGVGGFTIRGK